MSEPQEKPNLTLAEIREKKQKMENDIALLISRFCNETGLRVNRLEIRDRELRFLTGAQPVHYVLEGVTAEVEIK